MNYREKIRKAIECPQFGNTNYGEWGDLRLDQRKYIKLLLDELDGADAYILQLYEENQQLKEQVKDLRRSIERKESTIIELEQEKVPYTNEYVEKLEKVIKEAVEWVDINIQERSNSKGDYWCNMAENGKEKLLDILNIDKGE